MKKLTYILFVLCLSLYSCGMTDVWKDWDGQGIMSDDRLRPSELKKVLSAADGWKMTYKGVVFYYEFDSEGNVISNTDETILEAKVTSKYSLSFKGEDILLLSIEDLGALKYLSEGQETTFVITAFSNQEITATGNDGGEQMNMTAVTAADIKNNEDKKTAIIIAQNKELFYEQINDMYKGVIRDASGEFIAYYVISGENKEIINFSILQNRVLTHEERNNLTISVDEENGVFSFDAITINGKSVEKIFYSFADKSLSTDTKLKVTIKDDALSYYMGKTDENYETYKLNGHNNTGDAKEELWQELKWEAISDAEINNRTERPVVFCPGSGYGGYIFYNLSFKATDDDRVCFTKTRSSMEFGGDVSILPTADEKLSKFLAAWFHEDGFYVIRGTNGKSLYFISPTTDNWIKAVR